jgi:hypothetical protein
MPIMTTKKMEKILIQRTGGRGVGKRIASMVAEFARIHSLLIGCDF